ncbi:MAG: hypothetical protein LWW93_10860 [Hyphomicrobiales bacterium]|nr:hypothetical protein [Hyphomicrobiales bacterium]
MISRDALRSIHAAAGFVGLATIAVFMTSTVAVEAMGDPATIAVAKRAIAWGLLLLIPALAAAGGSGFRLSGGAKAGAAAVKAKRMRIVAANGLVVLVPAALFLATRATAGAFDGLFTAVQAIELAAGATNLTLLTLNLRDGLAMAAKRKSRRPVEAS